MPLTFFLAQFFGLLFLILSFAMFFQKTWIMEVIAAFLRDKALLFVTGVINLSAGILMLLVHNVWYGGVLPVVITILGWLIFLRGLVLVGVPLRTYEKLYRYVNIERNYYTFTSVLFIIGLYLAIAGFGWM